jgi:hypothetical protein
MLRCGFTDADSAGVREQLRESVGAQLYDDVVYLLQRIHSLPDTTVSSRRWFRPDHLGVAQPAPDRFLFDRAIANLRADKRSVTLPKSHGTSYGRGANQNTVVSTRVMIPSNWSTNVPRTTPRRLSEIMVERTRVQRPTPFQTRPEKLHGECVDLCPLTTPPIWSKPMHDFYYGDLSEFDSKLLGGSPKFAPNPLKSLKGERPYLVFEPTPKQVKQWKKKWTKKNGEFKKSEYRNEFYRLQQMISKSKFKSHYADGVVKTTRGFTGIMLGKQYLGQLQVPLYQDQSHPPRSQPSTLDSIFPTRIDSPEQIVWTSSVRPLGFYGITPCTPPGIQVPEINWTCLVNCEPTRQLLNDAEEALRSNADYNPKLHRGLGHLYRYWYKYYPADRNMSEVFSETRNTMSQSKPRDIHAEIRAEWDTAIRVTFGVTPLGDIRDIPGSGFYAIHKMSEQATTRVYLVLPNPPPPDAWDDEEGPMWVSEDGELGGPPLVGKPDILANIRSAAAAVRSKHVNEMTIRRYLGKRVFPSDGGPKMTHIRFYQERGKLMWDLGYTSNVSVSA